MIPRIPMAQIHNMLAQICVKSGDAFIIANDCLVKLEEILKKLVTEDCTLRTYRRAIGFGQNIRKDLIPLLLHVKHDSQTSIKIIDVTIKILVELTIPVEYLLPIESMSATDVGKHTIFELNKLLSSTKEAFTDGRNTKIIIDHMKFIVESDLEMTGERCESVNNCLLLLRNILHVPETKKSASNGGGAGLSCMQNQIIWNLFTQSIDKIIIYLISCPQKIYWDVTLVQLIALLYKEQHVGTLQKLLNLWLEASLSESSEDNESNTSPPEQGSGDDSSPIITSDPTSDSSDGGGQPKRNKPSNPINKKTLMMRGKSSETETSASSGLGHQNSTESDTPSKKESCSQSEDFGYVTQVENQESISTSSNEDDQPLQKPVHHQKCQKSRFGTGKSRVSTIMDKKELRRKKLVKRSKTNTINMKGLMHHLPTDEDITNILKEFTVDFLLKGYGILVHDLHSQLLSSTLVQIDTSHFFWLITYFLKFAIQLELDLEHVSAVLSCEILSFLVFQGVWIYEEVEMCGRIVDLDLKPSLRRLHLVVTAIREFLQAVESYQKMVHLTEEDKATLNRLQSEITQMSDLRSLFLLLLRQYKANMQSKQYLQDLIVTNHNYLLLLDRASKEATYSFDIMAHLKQFATVEIMRQYGILLENFKENGEFVNNCIFTMMHHVGGDLENGATLYQPVILKTFSLIWETDYQLCDDWSDLIEYIIHKFINSPRTTDPSNTFEGNAEENEEWTKEEKDNLLGYYNQSRYALDTIGNITKKYEKSGVKHKTQLSIIRQLLEQNVINQNQYDDFIKENQKPQVNASNNAQEMYKFNEDLDDGGIGILLEYLYKEDKGQFVRHLQSVLIDVCCVKLTLANPCEFDDQYGALKKSIVYHFALLNLPIPVVPWTSDLDVALKCPSFVLLLHKLGFYLPIDTGKLFVTIPNFWNAEHAFSIAQQIGTIDTSKLTFDVRMLKGANEEFRTQTCGNNSLQTSNFSRKTKQSSSSFRYTPLPNSPEWFQSAKVDPSLQLDMSNDPEENSVSETASITSDLTRMCVSDEEDKLILIIDKK